MVLVDSSVWIAYLSPRASNADQELEGLIRPYNQVVVTGIVFQEVIQGIRNQRSYESVQKLMQKLPFLIPSAETHFRAAELSKRLASKGKSVSTVDALIAALSIGNHISLFTLDKDFLFIEEYTPLKLIVRL